MNRSSLILVFLLFSAIRIMAANFSVEVDGLVYTQNSDDTTTVSLSSKSYHWNWWSGNNYSETSINVPSSILVDGVEYQVTALADCALNNCHNLISVTLPSSIKKIGSYAFSCCDKLKEIALPEGIESLQGSVFFNCYLDKIIIPTTLKELKFGAFNSEISSGNVNQVWISDLSKWCKVQIDGYYSSPRGNIYLNGEKLNNIVIPDDITEVLPYTFLANGAQTITIPNHVTSIGKNSFRSSSAVSIKVGNGVRIIEERAITGANFEYIELGENVDTIVSPSFEGVGSKLKTFICYSLIPPVFTTNEAFYRDWNDETEFYNLDNATLLVPKGSQKLYRNAPVWSRFGLIKEMEEDNAISIFGDLNNDGLVDVVDVNIIINIILGKYRP